MRKIAVFTGARSEYGLLFPLLKQIQQDADLELQLIVSAMHLSPDYGYTVQSIEQDGFAIAARIETLLSSDSPVGTLKSLGLGIIGYADALERLKPDMLVLLGDRYEALGMAQAALIMQIPVLHLHGGEITEGAYDDAIRHAITKMSSYHATSCVQHRQRVIQLGESPERVFNVGAIGLDNIRGQHRASRADTLAFLGLAPDTEFIFLTYHPVTAADEAPAVGIAALIQALESQQNYAVVASYPNADNGGKVIIQALQQWQASSSKVKTVASFGHRYLDVVSHAALVIGNSSSGIIEIPSLAVPVVNVGVRQQGRECSKHIVHCPPEPLAISHAMQQALQTKDLLSAADNPYDAGQTSQTVARLLAELPLTAHKKFFDIH